MRNTSLILALLVLFLAPAACATIIHGTGEDINIHSTPDSASISVDNVAVGRTPFVYKMSRKDDHTVTFALPGYEPTSLHLTRSVSGWFFGNLIIGGIIGLAVDAISGGMYNLKPNELQAALAKGGVTAQVQPDGLYLLVVMQPDPTWTRIGTLEPAH